MKTKRLLFVLGHYGSGKSEVSINLALKEKYDELFDLDIVNPYFRSRDVIDLLKKGGIEVTGSTIENSSGSDLPYISPRSFTPIRTKQGSAIYDLGGEDVGARVLRQYVDEIDFDDTDFYCVINTYRAETSTPEGIIKMVRMLEGGAGCKITGFINNTNLLRDTTIEDIKNGESIILEACKKLNLDIKYTCMWHKIVKTDVKFEGEILELGLHLRKEWL